MRPIKLKIKGLNSFMEEQIIDFTELTSRGLFGIIGPTGSGKTTVLDGITLALYGEVARKSKNFINSNCTTAQVSFEFQISGACVKRYVVEREFKLDKKSGNIRSGKCRLLDITSGEAEVLAESVGGVTSSCKDIIGLTLEDFTRTVVLPQGKFSEFLKLEGADRRNMLERLFHLEEYGDHLSKKLAVQVTKAKEENTYLAGQLMGYEGYHEEGLKQKEEEQTVTTKALQQVVKDNTEFFIRYQSYEELWKLLKEKEQYETEQAELLLDEAKMQGIKHHVTKCESALLVEPYYNQFQETTKAMEQVTSLLTLRKKQESEIKKEKESVDELFLKWQKRKEEELPTLAVKEQKTKDAMEEETVVKELEQKTIRLQQEKTQLVATQTSLQQTIQNIEQKLLHQKQQNDSLEEQIQKLKVDPDYKEQLNKGANLSIQINDILRRLREHRKKEEEKNCQIQQQQQQLLKDKQAFVKHQTYCSVLKKKVEEYAHHNPGTQEDLLQLQSRATKAKEAYKLFQEIKEACTQLEIELGQGKKKKEEKEQQIQWLQHQVKQQKELVEKEQKDQLAAQLRTSLLEGEPCPVCGSTHHKLEQVSPMKVIEGEAAKVLQSLEQALDQANNELTSITSRFMTANTLWEQQQFRLKAVKETKDYEQANALEQQFHELKGNMEQYIKEKEQTEKECKQAELKESQQFNNIKAQEQMIAKHQEDVKELQETIKVLQESETELKKEYNELAEQTKTREFRDKYEAVLKQEKLREDCMKQLTINRSIFEKNQTMLTEEKEQKKNIAEQLAKLETTIGMNESSIKERKQSIVDKVGVCTNLTEVLQQTIQEISQIQTAFQSVNEQKQTIDDQYSRLKDELIQMSANSLELTNRKEREEKELIVRMNEQGFASVEEFLSDLGFKQELVRMREQLNRYQEKIAMLKGAMERVDHKIKGRTLTKEQWDEVNNKKTELEQQLEKLKEQQLKLQSEILQIKQKIAEQGELLQKKQRVQQRLDRLIDLEKLFKGKKFVEYVASTRLKYISIEASKKLKEITNDTYGLEVDENGKFFIRDYKNGGAARDASTLSGGETFVASLALALALSAQIQLKGTAPLELFFLDEGFGTLDENLLDVVMTSIEQIHNDKLKVGLITHVESVKNRVPVKLMVSPAESGRGGSKVRIEYN